jgi:hypothetical protein
MSYIKPQPITDEDMKDCDPKMSEEGPLYMVLTFKEKEEDAGSS